jgi:hypothetical protein
MVTRVEIAASAQEPAGTAEALERLAARFTLTRWDAPPRAGETRRVAPSRSGYMRPGTSPS